MVSETYGYDFSTSKPSPAAVVAGGARFVVGYVSPLRETGPAPKDLSAGQLADYRAAGISVGLVWESAASRALSGAAGGAADGAAAGRRARAIGYMAGCVIFAAVDFDVSPAQLPTVLAYCEGFRAACLPYEAGVYGSARVVDYCANSIPWRWQTAAWSGGVLHPAAHLYQRNKLHNPGPAGAPVGSWDENVLCAPLPLFGASPAQSAPAGPPPAPAQPAPPAFDVRAWRVSRGDVDPHLPALQRWGNVTYPAYCKIAPVADQYGPQTAAFIREFAHRSGIAEADGQNIGRKIAAALYAAGFRG